MLNRNRQYHAIEIGQTVYVCHGVGLNVYKYLGAKILMCVMFWFDT